MLIFALIPNTRTNANGGSAPAGQSRSLGTRRRKLQSYWRSDVSLSYPDYLVHYLKAIQVLTWKPWTYIMKISFLFKFFVITIMEATMMPVEKLRGEAELASDTNDMKFFLVSVVAF